VDREDGEIDAHAALHRQRRVERPAGGHGAVADAEQGQVKGRVSRMAAGGSSQKPQLLRRGSAMSGAPIISGIIQLAKPVAAGISAAKIITSACTPISWLKNSGCISCRPGWNKLGPHGQDHRAADEEHDQREGQVHRADVLVIRRGQPAHHAAG
jgi:hypothetical protein